MSESTKTTKVFRNIWASLFVLALIVEAASLPHGHRDTLSETIWDVIRWSHWRLLFLPAWTWLTWHWVLRKTQVIDWKDGVAIAIGLVWAILELYFHRNS